MHGIGDGRDALKIVSEEGGSGVLLKLGDLLGTDRLPAFGGDGPFNSSWGRFIREQSLKVNWSVVRPNEYRMMQGGPHFGFSDGV